MPTSIFSKKNNKVSVSLFEYERLKKISRDFGRLVKFVEHVRDIKKARIQVKQGQGVAQEKLFKELGI